jgi:hydroxyacylglutathione hydrolase
VRLVIDTRDPEAFAAGHAPGSLNIQRTWGQLQDRTLSYVPDRSQPIALRAASLSNAQEGAAILKELGYSDVSLYEGEGTDEAGSLELILATDLKSLLDTGATPIIIDIRQASEFETGVIDHATLVDQDEGPRAVADLDKGQRYVILCEGGWRSSQLASWMQSQGFTDVVHVIDGMAGWRDL